jgi:fructokinase
VIIVAGEHLVDLIVDPSMQVQAVPGGGPFTTARTIARLRGTVAFLGRISTDRFGRDAMARLAADGVQSAYIQRTDEPTTLAVAELDADGAAVYRFHTSGTAAAGLREDALPAAFASLPVAVHVGTLGLVLEPMATTIEALVGGLDPTTVLMLDINARPAATPDVDAFRARVARLIRRADLVKVSVDDLAILHPGLDADAALDQLAAAGPRVVLRTDGARPVVVAAGPARRQLPIPSVPVVDTVGAGDAFGGGFLHAWVAAGRGRAALHDIEALVDAAAFAIRVATATVGRAGAEPPTPTELEPVPA